MAIKQENIIMKYSILLFVIGLFMNISQAQDQFIEIEVYDTVQVESEEIFYSITVSSEEMFSLSGFTQGKTMNSGELEEILRSTSGVELIEHDPNKIKTELLNEMAKTYRIKASSIDAIHKLASQLSGFSNLYGSISELKVTVVESIKLKLKRKLLEKARIEAESTLSLINKELGQLVGIYEYMFRDENKNASKNDGWTSFSPFSKLKEPFISNQDDPSKVVFSQKMKVKYWIE